MNNLRYAAWYSRAAHGDALDKSGAPYWKHPARVMLRLGFFASTEAKIVALLHDVVEDTHVHLDDLRGAFSEDVVEAVRLLTRDKTVAYFDYIAALAASGNRLAITVKLADLGDNLDPRRPRPDSLTARYLKARAMLEAALN